MHIQKNIGFNKIVGSPLFIQCLFEFTGEAEDQSYPQRNSLLCALARLRRGLPNGISASFGLERKIIKPQTPASLTILVLLGHLSVKFTTSYRKHPVFRSVYLSALA